MGGAFPAEDGRTHGPTGGHKSLYGELMYYSPGSGLNLPDLKAGNVLLANGKGKSLYTTVGNLCWG